MMEKGFRNWVLTSILNINRKHLINMIDFPVDEDSLILDIGCNVGSVTRHLSLRAKTIGLEIDKDQVRWAKKCNKHIDFVCCDISHLPLIKSSVNVVVCSSVLEHIKNLDEALEEIAFVLKDSGEIVAGYPIETRMLEFLVKSFCRSVSADSTWGVHDITSRKELLKSPHTHKQTFAAIREILGKDFSLLKKWKMPLTSFPDLISIYEISLLVKKQN